MARRSGGSFRVEAAEEHHRGGDAAALPANLMRTMPYTSYVAIGSYAVLFASEGAGWLTAALVTSEVLNAGVKQLLRLAGGGHSRLLRRPDGAMDSGIYPQHYPRASTSSGMPSGHSQTAGLLAVVLSAAVLDAQQLVLGTPETLDALMAKPFVIVQLAFVWLVALSVMLSRTRFAGPLGVKVDGRRIAHHTALQVMVGGTVGLLLGLAAVGWYRGRPLVEWFFWLVCAAVLLVVICVAARLERTVCGGSSDSDSDRKVASDSDRTSNSAWSDRSTEDASDAEGGGLAHQEHGTSPGIVGQALSLN